MTDAPRKRPTRDGARARSGREKSRGYGVPADSGTEAPRRKNLRLHQSKIDAARAVLGTGTETETIEAALDLIVFRNELVEGVRGMRGAELVDVFDEEQVPRYVIDTNLYIRATRDAAWNQALETSLSAFAPWVHLQSVVAMELLAAATSLDLERRTHARFIAPFERRGRVITPGAAAWQRAGGAMAKLSREKKLSLEGINRSFIGDCLIAASARDEWFTLVTANMSDFALLGGILPLRVLPPWPDPVDAGPVTT